MRVKQRDVRAVAIAEAVVSLKAAELHLAAVRLDADKTDALSDELDQARAEADKTIAEIAERCGFPADARKVTFDADGTVIDRETGKPWKAT